MELLRLVRLGRLHSCALAELLRPVRPEGLRDCARVELLRPVRPERLHKYAPAKLAMPPGTNSDHANHLLLDVGGGLFVSMAHLRQGSVTVETGDVVRRGQTLAAVGNNGHSNEPHLHLQVQDSPATADADRTYPMVFRNVDITRGGVWPWGEDREVRTGDLVRAPGR